MRSRWVVLGLTLLVACNAILGNEQDREVAATDAGTDADAEIADVTVAETTAPIVDAAIETKPPGDAGPVPAKGLDVRYPVVTGTFLVQCTTNGTVQDVWQSLDHGSDVDSRFAEFKYTQEPEVFLTCLNEGAKDGTGHYPIVLTSLTTAAVPDQTLVAKCVSAGTSDTYAVNAASPVQGHPAARFVKTEPYAACP